MRAVVPLLSASLFLSVVTFQGGCASSQRIADRSQLQSELELAFDDGQPAERPLLPGGDGEWLIRFDPTLPAYKPQRLRLLVAQPGKIRFAIYRSDESGRPGAKLTSLERTYEVNHTSSGMDGKWVLEPIGDLPVLSGTLWIGISVPTTDPTAARLWVSRKESGQVFQRDSEPGTALQSTKLPMTPMVRLLLSAEQPVPQPAAKPATETDTKKATTGAAATTPAQAAPQKDKDAK